MAKPNILIIGAGFTGVATAHDLALRGCDVTVVERGPIANGTSGRTHGLLHSGGRYAVKDQESAIECIDENMILRKIVPSVIEPNGGLFVALNEKDVAYGEDFIAGCEACHIPIEEVSAQQALQMEPYLNPGVLAAFTIPDGTFDPLRLALAFAATAKKHGAKFLLYHEVKGLLLDGQGNVTGVKVIDLPANKEKELRADIVVNATGAWVGEITAMAGADVPIHPTPGIMVAFDQRTCQRVINRLCPPADGDIILPQRRMMVVGTTSFTAENLDYIPIIEEQINEMLARAYELSPQLKNAKLRGIYNATRPLVGGGSTGRSIARTFKCFDHKESDNVDGFVTITGGKATTLRAMAEKTTDVVLGKLGLNIPCQTMDYPLVSYREFYALNN
ncbi:MAG TPA: FAD-dependent oxidoreductase [Anaerolineales bacterium]|nr:FAD-dependent oxidoreductase [Anaerolineales bacterium]